MKEKVSHLDASINANAEKLRSHFVQHKGKKELVVEANGSRYTVDFGALAHQMTDKLHKNVRSDSDPLVLSVLNRQTVGGR